MHEAGVGGAADQQEEHEGEDARVGQARDGRRGLDVVDAVLDQPVEHLHVEIKNNLFNLIKSFKSYFSDAFI